jgi:hypothetical protein
MVKRMRQANDTVIWLEETIARFVGESPENSVRNESQERAWDEPLVGFSRGDDPLYREFKEHIGSFYWTPLEAFLQAFPETAARGGSSPSSAGSSPRRRRLRPPRGERSGTPRRSGCDPMSTARSSM